MHLRLQFLFVFSVRPQLEDIKHLPIIMNFQGFPMLILTTV